MPPVAISCEASSRIYLQQYRPYWTKPNINQIRLFGCFGGVGAFWAHKIKFESSTIGRKTSTVFSRLHPLPKLSSSTTNTMNSNNGSHALLVSPTENTKESQCVSMSTTSKGKEDKVVFPTKPKSSLSNGNVAGGNASSSEDEDGDDDSSSLRSNGIDMSSLRHPFPWKLHQLLDDVETDGNDSIISWVPKEGGFKIHQPERFTKDIMPGYFKQTRFTSFTRQVCTLQCNTDTYYCSNVIEISRNVFYLAQCRTQTIALHVWFQEMW